MLCADLSVVPAAVVGLKRLCEPVGWGGGGRLMAAPSLDEAERSVPSGGRSRCRPGVAEGAVNRPSHGAASVPPSSTSVDQLARFTLVSYMPFTQPYPPYAPRTGDVPHMDRPIHSGRQLRVSSVQVGYEEGLS